MTLCRRTEALWGIEKSNPFTVSIVSWLESMRARMYPEEGELICTGLVHSAPPPTDERSGFTYSTLLMRLPNDSRNDEDLTTQKLKLRIC
jgi:hypothetical protein